MVVRSCLASVNTLVYGFEMDDRLSKSDWVRHGLRVLEREGAQALKAAPLADQLGVSRGSFYWHFKDIKDYRAHVLSAWRESMTDRVIHVLEAEGAEPERLLHLLQRAFVTRGGLERAIRSWASTDKAVARAVAAVDAQRVSYIAQLLGAAGVAKRVALHRASVLNWAYLGRAVAMDDAHPFSEAALRDITRLFES